MQNALRTDFQHPLLLPFPSLPSYKPQIHSVSLPHTGFQWPLLHFRPSLLPPLKCYETDEFPVDETIDHFLPQEPTPETEAAARRENWIERGWAPWEEILTPEGHFARKSLEEGEEVPLQTPEAIEAFKLLRPSYRKKKMEESGLDPDDWYVKTFSRQPILPDSLGTTWEGPLVVRPMPPRDWPPRDWKVDEEELRYIREGHKMQSVRVNLEDVESRSSAETDNVCLDRWKVFLKQYKEWVAANKDRLEEESYKFDQDYYPGRRKRGDDYKEGMLELPFVYPEQIYAGKVTTLHLYQGAFVDIGCVYEGWVPIKRNDWYWLRHHIKVGMPVIVEVLAKRDPYRFRFPIELRFVDPNIDHLIFNKFDFPPIFQREEDTNPEELWRDAGRTPVPRERPEDKVEDLPLLSNHPYVDKLWQLHVAEQMILDDEEANPDKYKDRKAEPYEDEDFDEENSVEYTEVHYKKSLLPKMILKTNVKELDLDAACAERQLNRKLKKQAADRREEYKVSKLRRNIEMDEYDLIHWRRSFEEREALLRDISCRQAVGLPVEEPGRYVDPKVFNKGKYDPNNPVYRYDYWGEPKNSEKSKQERMTEIHNKSVVGKGTVWYQMSYQEAIKQKMRREARAKAMKRKGADEDERKEITKGSKKDDEDDDDDDFDYSILGSYDPSDKPVVNGTESSRISDKGMFEN